MKNTHGSVLIVTLGFVVAFTLLGMASLHYAMLQNEATEIQKASMEAFWLADGAVELAKAKMPGFIEKDNPPVNMVNADGDTDNNRYYDVVSRKKVDPTGYQRKFRYEVLTYGTVNGQSRFIKAEFDQLNIPDYPFIVNKEVVNSPVEPLMVDKIDHFAKEACDGPWVDGIPTDGFTGVTCVTLIEGKTLTVPKPAPDEVANVLVIDVREVNKIDNGTFVPIVTFDSQINGIVLVLGNVKFNEVNLNSVNLKINGTLLVDGKAEFIDNDKTEKAELVFDAKTVDEALLLLPHYNIRNGVPVINAKDAKIISWEEVAQLEEAI